MSLPDPRNRADYGPDGGIIIPEEMVGDSECRTCRAEIFLPYKGDVLWTVTGDEFVVREHRPHKGAFELPDTSKPSVEGSMRFQSRQRVQSILREGQREWGSTMKQVRVEGEKLRQEIRVVPRVLRSVGRRFWIIAITPWSIPAFLRPSRRAERSRLFAFVLDTVRFGGTFATIFVVLFVGINAQSFWDIAKAKLALSDEVKTEQGLTELTRLHSERGAADAADATNTAHAHPIFDFVPMVGPPDNRLIIPKLGKNIPIIEPPIDALISEDWKKFDGDLQNALLLGSIHYPGSAKPGQAGNFFVTAHSSYYPWVQSAFKDAFARLGELSIGDTYSVYYGGDLHSYRVTTKLEVKPTDVSVLDQPMDKRLSTLMTCTPVGTTLRRLVVQAEEIDPETGQSLKVGERSTEEKLSPARLKVLPI